MVYSYSIREGEFTATIYGFIKEQKYREAVSVLNQQLELHPGNRAAMSLLGYCFYQMQDFVSASDCYEQLTQLYPEIEDYRIYFAQALHKAGLFQPAMKVAVQIENPKHRSRILKLQVIFSSPGKSIEICHVTCK